MIMKNFSNLILTYEYKVTILNESKKWALTELQLNGL